MANHFPVLPSMSLGAVGYMAAIEQTGQSWPSAGFDVAGVTVGGVQFAEAQEQTGIFTITFTFTAPGSPGSFDQDAAEAQVATVLNDLAQAVAVTGGIPLAQVQAMTTVSRTWTWKDTSGLFTAAYTDQMTYPPA